MHLKEGYVLKEVAGENVLFPIGQGIVDGGSLMSVNETGRYIVELLQQEITDQELIQKLMERFEAEGEEEREIIYTDLFSFLDGLWRNSMLVL